MGWEEEYVERRLDLEIGWVGKKNMLGRRVGCMGSRIGWEVGVFGKKDGLGRRIGWEEE